ncbi:rho guanine nucleotide exchange factor 10-like protein isoform X2 [Agrilus planipennis]|uniref:Rho guanine nucleotide exchange factor 10-like protein isoform X2 n=1 Tax=Agrilus planipennis TaxID=224129 RepID=A0A1W4X366_AGRPL|nr:rho guanine nucleotide exchange factor 10-like protein isoform X2 [Agrilus planipennis]
MWQVPSSSRQKCVVEQMQPCPQHKSISLRSRRYPPQPPQTLLHFPPPPNYPPPQPMDPRIPDDHFLNLPGPSTSHHHHHPVLEPTTWDYSYAYYEPGPPKKHTNIPNKYPGGREPRDGPYREGSYRSKHTYLTRYGTEENIYEEISEVARARMNAARHQQSIMSLNQSLVEEEVRRVQSGHKRVLEELNLSVEAMLMPSSREGSDDSTKETDDQLADLFSVGPTDELLSPVPSGGDLDSGFSGSSSGASYRSAAGSLRRGPSQQKKLAIDSKSGDCASGSKGFFSRKAWKKLTGFSSGASSNKQTDEPRVRSGTWEEATPERRMAPPLGHSRTLHHSMSQRSSEDSWCSGSDVELSSEDESDRSITSSTRGSGQLRNTLNKARTLCDKWRGSGGAGSNNKINIDSNIPLESISPQNFANQGRLSRWFSIRRSSVHQYDIDNTSECPKTPQNTNKMPLLPEVEEENFINCSGQQRRQVPPTLPPSPPNLSPQQLKRRMIVAAIVHSENTYVAALQRLVNDYKKPLQETHPPILNGSKISILFHKLSEILQCHILFRIALATCVQNWDRDEKIGDVFVASFSKSIVLEIYSEFINNFSVAMDLAKMEAKRKSALADFLKVKQISSHDRLSFFGLMVKPVQRFPQFILFLQDLLKHTPQGHHDRMSLQLALTQLESLTEMLNERKRESEQFQAFKEMLRNISGKFSIRPLSDGNRYLIREDNVTQLEFNQCGMITKTKSRRLLLLNDLIVCVAVTPKSLDNFGAGERLNLKWTHPVSDIEIQDTSASPTLSRILTAGVNRGGSLRSNNSFDGTQPSQGADNLCTEMSNLMHDYEAVSRISDLVGTLRGSYRDLSVDNMRKVLHQIQKEIQKKDEEMAWMDSCCLQLMVKGKAKEEIFTFQAESPAVKREWITELRLAQLALDPNNSPSWDIPEQEQRPSTKMPLFVKAQKVYKSQHQSEVRCGCFYTVNSPKLSRRRTRSNSYLWLCTSDGASSHIKVLSQHHQQSGTLKDFSSFSLVETQVTAMEHVKGVQPPCPSLAVDTVWMGTDSRRLILYAGDEPEKQEEVGSSVVPDVIIQIKYHCDNVFVALGNGTLLIYRRNPIDSAWILKDPQILNLGHDPVSSLLPINYSLYAGCGKKVWVVNSVTGEIQKNFSIQHEHGGNVNLMTHSGIGLWISLKNSSTVCLYHTETFKHLQDINIASNVLRSTATNRNSGCYINGGHTDVYVTALLACKGLLWVGTNVGIILTIPLPRLEGVPIISGRMNISYHAHFGPITFLLALQPKNGIVNPTKRASKEIREEVTVHRADPDTMNPSINGSSTPEVNKEKENPETSVAAMTAKLRQQLTNSPVVLRRKRSKDGDISRLSKTLPRSIGNGGSIFSSSSASSHGSGDTCDVYGLYGDLMYVKDYEGEENIYESLRRSDPELAMIPGKVSTLDRRLKMKVSRPRSLDLSNWSVDSRSSSLYTSSGSEESMAMRNSVGRSSISRNNSNVSRQLNDVCENSVSMEKEPKPNVTSFNNCSNSNNNNSNSNSKTVQNCKTWSGGRGAAEANTRRTIITLMGGRGYVNWRQPCCPSDKSKNSFSIRETNNNDAHIVIWELKL